MARSIDEFQYKKLFRFRIIRLTQLPRKLIEGSENLQVSTLRPQLHDTGFASERHQILLFQGDFGT